MVQYAPADASHFGPRLFRDFLLTHLQQTDTGLLGVAAIGVSVFLGNHPSRLNEDRDHREFVQRYVNEVLLPFTGGEASLILGVRSLGGLNSTGNVFKGFCDLAGKARKALGLDGAELDPHFATPSSPLTHLFMAVVALTALHCHHQKELAALHGVRKTMLGRWKST